MENNEVIVKQKTNKGVIIVLIILLLGALGYIVYDKFLINEQKNSTNGMKQTTIQDNTKNDNQVIDNSKNNSIDNEQVLKEVTEVYENAFDDFSTNLLEEGKTLEYYKNKYDNRFTDDGLYRVFQMLNDTNSGILSTIFNITDQGKRTLTLVYTDNNIAIATGVFIPIEDWGSKTPYPEYIVFKKVDGVWKIDMFE